MLAQTSDSVDNGIVFLHVRFKADGTLELLDAQSRPGRLKANNSVITAASAAAPARGHMLQCAVASASGAPFWTGDVPDPSRRHIESEDPTQPGHLVSKEVQVPTAEFMVRVPLYEKTQRVEFRRPVAAATTDTSATGAGTASAAASATQLLGSFSLTLP
jgi:hypothetical protein